MLRSIAAGQESTVMAVSPMIKVVRHLRKCVLLREGTELTDGQLLECYINRREEAAMEALVRLHAPMVMGVCCRLLRHRQDAEDAFQATFLVLVRKAAAIASRELLANWLYGVQGEGNHSPPTRPGKVGDNHAGTRSRP